MTDTGWKNPAATGETENAWTNPTNAYTQNDIYATVLSMAAPNMQDYYDFTFGIPDGATINGIELSIDAFHDGEEDGSYRAWLSWDGGTNWSARGDEKDSATIPTSDEDVYTNVGDSTDLWGRSWSDSELSNTNFRVKIMPVYAGMLGATFSFDHIRMKIYYTAAPPPPYVPRPTVAVGNPLMF